MPRPHLDAWLRRLRRELAPSGRLTELALQLAAGDGRDPDHWRRELRAILDAERPPTLDEITAIDALIALPGEPSPGPSTSPLPEFDGD